MDLIDKLRTEEMIYLNKLKFCSLLEGSTSFVDSVHKRLGIPSQAECLEIAETTSSSSQSSRKSILKTIDYYLLSREPYKSLQTGLDYLREQITSDNKSKIMATYETLIEVVDRLNFVNRNALTISNESFQTLLCVSYYFGAFLAIRRDYKSIIVPLLSCVMYGYYVI